MTTSHSRILGGLAVLAWTTHALALPAAAQEPPARGYLADRSLAFLEPLIGSWAPGGLPDDVDPEAVGKSYAWIVGGNAVRILEGMRAGPDGTPELEGMIYWNPATELVEFVAVAGHGEGQGRYFVGEYRELEDGSIERTYDVFYRTAADMPGEAFGGTRRRYRETYRFTDADHITSTLEWFHDGAWRGFGRFAEGSFVRLR